MWDKMTNYNKGFVIIDKIRKIDQHRGDNYEDITC